jgi:Tfp pilus assembly protein PilN
MSTANAMSFLPENYLAEKAARRTNLICASLFFVVVIAILAAYALSNRSLRSIEKQHDVVQQQYAEAAQRIDQVKQLQTKQQLMSQQAALASSLLEKVPRSNLLAEITNSLPDGVSLVDMKLVSKERTINPPAPPAGANTNGVPPKPPAPTKVTDVSIDVSGVAGDDGQVAQFIRNLTGSKLLKDVNLVVVDESKIGSDTVRRFQLNMMINPDANLLQEGNK